MSYPSDKSNKKTKLYRKVNVFRSFNREMYENQFYSNENLAITRRAFKSPSWVQRTKVSL